MYGNGIFVTKLNAKELILKKINADTNWVDIYTSAFMLGEDLSDIGDFMISPEITELINKFTTNIFDPTNVGTKTMFIEQAIKDADTEHKKALYTELLERVNISEELRIFGKILKINQGMPTKTLDLYEYINSIESFIEGRLNVDLINQYKQALNNLQEAIGDDENPNWNDPKLKAALTIYKSAKEAMQTSYIRFNFINFLQNSDYQDQIVNQYESVKVKFNILDALVLSPHFSQMQKVLALNTTILNALSKRNDIESKVWRFAQHKNAKGNPALLGSLNTTERETLKKLTEQTLIHEWISIGLDGMYVEYGSQRFDFNSGFDPNKFKIFVESIIIPLLKYNMLKTPNGDTIPTRDNEFVKKLTFGKHNGISIYKLPFNMTEIDSDESTRLEYEKILNAFGDLRNITLHGGLNITDIFYLYNLIVHNDHFGRNSLTRLFEDLISSKDGEKLLVFKFNEWLETVNENEIVDKVLSSWGASHRSDIQYQNTSSNDLITTTKSIESTSKTKTVKYTPKEQVEQTYTIIGTKIFNKEGNEVYSDENSGHRKLIFVELALQEKRAVKVEYRNVTYVVNDRNQIFSTSSNKIVYENENDGNRRVILEKAKEEFAKLSNQSSPRVEIYQGYWTREEVESQIDKVFLFGDNTDDRVNTHYVPSRTQAVIRGLDNAIGIDTKKNRGTSEGWGRYSTNNYEVSSAGDIRFSAKYARFKEGTIIFGHDVSNRTIESVYQNGIKQGDWTTDSNTKTGIPRSKEIIKGNTEDASYYEGYLPLWQEWAKQNPQLIEELREKSAGKTLTDKFANTRVSQARALSDIIKNGSYFTDADFDSFKTQVDEAIQRAIDSGKTIVIPADGIGTGKAELDKRAPKLFAYLQQRLDELKSLNSTNPIQFDDLIDISEESVVEEPVAIGFGNTPGRVSEEPDESNYIEPIRRLQLLDDYYRPIFTSEELISFEEDAKRIFENDLVINERVNIHYSEWKILDDITDMRRWEKIWEDLVYDGNAEESENDFKYNNKSKTVQIPKYIYDRIKLYQKYQKLVDFLMGIAQKNNYYDYYGNLLRHDEDWFGDIGGTSLDILKDLYDLAGIKEIYDDPNQLRLFDSFHIDSDYITEREEIFDSTPVYQITPSKQSKLIELVRQANEKGIKGIHIVSQSDLINENIYVRSAKGFVRNGEIYINIDRAGDDTVIHEFGHLYLADAKVNNREKYYELLEKVRQTKLWSDMKTWKAYANKIGSDFDEEVLATMIGDYYKSEFGIDYEYTDLVKEALSLVDGGFIDLINSEILPDLGDTFITNYALQQKVATIKGRLVSDNILKENCQ